MSHKWTTFFFQNCSPNPIELFNESIQDPNSLQRFKPDGSWILGKRVTDNTPPGHQILILELILWKGKSEVKYVAKTSWETSQETAKVRINISGLKGYSVEEVQRQLDPFLVESRAFEHIQRCCPDSHRVYFPQYFGVLTDIKRDKYSVDYLSRPRAIVLEAIKPELASRRILAAETRSAVSLTEHIEKFSEELENIVLSHFEKSWYQSLFSDRLRRLMALHNIGITHGDVKDDHFRLPEDFYDTVLYDFSSSYTFSPSRPCLRRPQPLSILKNNEQNILRGLVLQRAEQLDFRHHLAKSLQLDLEIIKDLCSRTLENEEGNLELIVVKVMNRPDDFSLPSLASIFPFLEGTCPKDSPTWHITRARLLQHYVSAWVLYTEDTDTPQKTLISFSGNLLVDMDGLSIGKGHTFFLLLLPRFWSMEGVHNKLMAACARVISSGKPGSVITKVGFENLWN